MPDIWTYAPEKMRTALTTQGATCGVESRVLHPRDPEWTCHINSSPWSYDVYIHSVNDLLFTWSGALPLFVMVGGFSLLVGLLWGRVFWGYKLR